MSNKAKITIGIIIILLIGATFIFSTDSSLFRGFIKIDKRVIISTDAKPVLATSPTFVPQNITPGSNDILVGKWDITAKEDLELINLGFDIVGGSITGKNAKKYFPGIVKIVSSSDIIAGTIYSAPIQSQHLDGICTSDGLGTSISIKNIKKGTTHTIFLNINLSDQAPIGSNFKATLCSDATLPPSATAPDVTVVK